MTEAGFFDRRDSVPRVAEGWTRSTGHGARTSSTIRRSGRRTEGRTRRPTIC
jgi:hypothetical protein